MKKYVSKKLRGKEEPLQVDTQLLRWRQRLVREGIILGKKSEKAEKTNRKQRKEREVETPEKLIASFKKKFGN